MMMWQLLDRYIQAGSLQSMVVQSILITACLHLFPQAQFEDVRCKCVCPSSSLDSKPNVTVKNIAAEDWWVFLNGVI